MKKMFAKAIVALSALAFMLPLGGCMDDNSGKEEEFDTKGVGLFIANEGAYSRSTASLSYYDPATKEVQNEVFARANGMKLGDTANYVAMFGNKVWIVMNGSNVVFAINPDTFKEEGRITGLNSPREIHFVSESKAYISQFYDNRIAVVNPSTCEITGYITVPGMDDSLTASTGPMVQSGRYVYCACPSYQKKIVKIDTTTDKVVDELEVGIQPIAIVLDRNDNIWCLTNGGGWEANPVGYEAPTISKIDTGSFKVVETLSLQLGDYVKGLAIDGSRENIYWLNSGVWKMNINASALPAAPLITTDSYSLYALTVNPANGEIYVADAVDYQQPGMVYRYSTSGSLIDKFYVGIIPGSFCWK
ncbi:YncE family protein [Muribaculum intestinale]|uniref:YncE family protein n=1 Tax=Muribaculum intestinale TaxID=1796646 RepID=UPI0025B4FDF6|nr:DUF5074 domain-containing protein [Muribaculum intestinale]